MNKTHKLTLRQKLNTEKAAGIICTMPFLIGFLAFMIIPTSFFIENNQICFYVRNYNLLCPSCGVTRAFSSIMHFNYVDAFNFNPIFTTSFGPIFIFLFIVYRFPYNKTIKESAIFIKISQLLQFNITGM